MSASLWRRLTDLLSGRGGGADPIPDDLWLRTLQNYSFLSQRPPDEQARLRELSARFVHDKEFHGAQGLVITDDMAVAVAAQACLPILNLGPAAQALDWYDDFVGIVMQPGEVLARREFTDETGVVHAYDEPLAGEAMDRGPVMLNWHDVARAGATAHEGYNLVVHEFVHKIDMRDGAPDGCPPLPAGFMGATGARQARQRWFEVLQPAYEEFREKSIIAQRFGGEPPWLDEYAAEAIGEFFAVACEAYFVNPQRFAQEFPTLTPLFDAFFLAGAPDAQR